MSLITPYKPEKLKAVYVSGDSITGTNINDGDVAVFHPGLIQGNGIYVVSVEDALLVKQVEFDGPGQAIRLVSTNQAYESCKYSGLELEKIRILDKILAHRHKI